MSDPLEDILKDTPFMSRISGDCVKCKEYRKRIEELERNVALSSKQYHIMLNKYERAFTRAEELQRKYEALVGGVKKLSNEWESAAMLTVPPEYAHRKLHYKYLRGDNYAGGRYDSAEELRALLEDDLQSADSEGCN